MVTVGLGVAVPNLAPITATWSAPLAFYYIFLSNRITYQRLKNKAYMGDRLDKDPATFDPTSDPLYIATRCHANFVENVPFALVLGALAELNGANRRTLHYALATFLALRVAHAELGLTRPKAMGLGRILGFYGTQTFFVGMAGWVAWLVRGYWGLD